MISPFRPAHLYHRDTGALMTRPVRSMLPPSKPRPPKDGVEALPEPGPPEITLANAVAWVTSESLTKLRGTVSLRVIQARTEACLKCPHRGQKRANPDEVGYCLVCGCGDSERGRLSRKIAMRQVKRPKGCLWPPGDVL